MPIRYDLKVRLSHNRGDDTGEHVLVDETLGPIEYIEAVSAIHRLATEVSDQASRCEKTWQNAPPRTEALIVRFMTDYQLSHRNVCFVPEIQLHVPDGRRVEKLWANDTLLMPESYIAMTGIILLRDFSVAPYKNVLPMFKAELWPVELEQSALASRT